METNEFRSKLTELNYQLNVHRVAAEKLSPLLEQHANKLFLQDEAASLDALLDRINVEFEDACLAEQKAQNEFATQQFIAGAIGFITQTIRAHSSNAKDPLYQGGEAFLSAISKEAPHGNVLVTISPLGIPEGVEVTPMADAMRQFNMNESDIIGVLREQGFLLMTLDTFTKLIQVVKKGVLESSVSLPLITNQIKTGLPDATFKLGTLLEIYLQAERIKI